MARNNAGEELKAATRALCALLTREDGIECVITDREKNVSHIVVDTPKLTKVRTRPFTPRGASVTVMELVWYRVQMSAFSSETVPVAAPTDDVAERMAGLFEPS